MFGPYFVLNQPMNNPNLGDRPTIQAHKRQFAWQILVPFLVVAGLIISGAVLIVTGGATRSSVWADISLIWLLIPALIIRVDFFGTARNHHLWDDQISANPAALCWKNPGCFFPDI